MKNGIKNAGQSEMSIDLEGCLVQVEASKTWFTRRVLPLSIEQLRWRPDPWHWSIGECLDHLNISLGLYLPMIDDAIGRGLAGQPCRAEHTAFACREIDAVRLVEPPVSVRTVAAPVLLPAMAVDPERLVDRFHQTRDRYADAVRRASELSLARILIANPIHTFLRTLGGTLAFIAAHDRRHMWQAEQVRNKPRFPRAVFTVQERPQKG
jgi:hypothetical protein